jgi:hypothetical protein
MNEFGFMEIVEEEKESDKGKESTSSTNPAGLIYLIYCFTIEIHSSMV